MSSLGILTSGSTPPLDASAVLAECRTLRSEIEAAEARLVELATQWADLHPADSLEEAAFPTKTLPFVHYDSTATFALNQGMSDSAGTDQIHFALELRERLPRVWARLQSGELQAWRARRIAQSTIHEPADIAAWVDTHIAAIAHKAGPITLSRIVQEAKVRLHPLETELASLDYLERRHVRLFDDLSPEGVATIEIRADLKDAYDFDRTVSEIAHILGAFGSNEPFDVRRSLAIGILADPQAAADLLHGDAEATTRPSQRKQVQLIVHLTPESLNGRNPVARLDRSGGVPMLERQVREWCGRLDSNVKVTPVVDLAHQISVRQYEVPERLKQQIQLRDGTCVFPHCTRPASACDSDHIEPYDEGGSTSTANLAPLCRRHHRLKTHAGWSYQRTGPASSGV
jgi:HNH endonuclease